MKKNIRYMIAAAMMSVATTSFAQNLNSAYFLDGFAYGHEINPAKDYERDTYVSMPFLGNISTSLLGNLNLKDILYKNPNGSGLVTYLHPSISSSEAMSAFSSNNKLISDFRMDIFSMGFHKWGGFNTIGLSIRENAGVNMPYEIFDLTKNLTNKDYNIGKLGAQATAWAELAFGHSRNINEKLRIGGKLKFLLAGARANAEMDNLRLDLSSENEWTAIANATVEASIKGFTWGETEKKEYKSKPGTYYNEINLDNADVDGGGLNGFGLAVDLGAEYDLGDVVEGMKVSASLLDLGFLKWNNTLVAQNKGEAFTFKGFNDIQVYKGEGQSIEDQADKFEDDLSKLYSIQDGGTKSVTSGLGATLNIGVEYTLPSFDKLKLGLLSTTRIQGVYSWNEERISANYAPAKWFEMAASVGVGTFGASFGWVANIHPKGFNFFIGMDHIIGKMSKQGIPLKSNSDISIGINFPLGNLTRN